MIHHGDTESTEESGFDYWVLRCRHPASVMLRLSGIDLLDNLVMSGFSVGAQLAERINAAGIDGLTRKLHELA